MDREEARQFKARWRLVNEYTAEEARAAPAALKLRQLSVMCEAARGFNWGDALRAGEEEVRERWRRLRETYHARA
ncbi:MAG TPA: hypothetical protein VG148_02740 [Pyrinomonadaceae bacterium]|nr:hypothetical protein [Pyrinomonadaceae bacterium]